MTLKQKQLEEKMVKSKEKIIFGYQHGDTVTSIAQTFDCSVNNILYYLRKWGVTLNRRSIFPVENLVKIENCVICMYRETKSIRKIAKQFKCKEASIKNILEKNGFNTSKKKLGVNMVNIEANQNILYWLGGLIASDGCLRSDNENIISLGQSGEHGKKMLEYVSSILEYKGKISVSYPKKCLPAFSLCVNSSIFSNILQEKFNITPRKSLTYTLPNIANENNFRDFLRGYFDGDGTLGEYPHAKTFVFGLSFLGTPEFLYDVNNRLKHKGFLLNLRHQTSKLEYNGERAVIFANWLFANSGLFQSKKYKAFLDFVNNPNKIPRWSIKNKAIFEFSDIIFSKKPVREVVLETNITSSIIRSIRKNNPYKVKKVGVLYIRDEEIL